MAFNAFVCTEEINSSALFFAFLAAFSACLLTNDIILTADNNHRIIQWRIQHDNLELISKKENAHDSSIYVLKKIGNGLIMSGDHNGEVKIW